MFPLLSQNLWGVGQEADAIREKLVKCMKDRLWFISDRSKSVILLCSKQFCVRAVTCMNVPIVSVMFIRLSRHLLGNEMLPVPIC